MSTVVVVNQKGSGCITQLLWFLFIGWWAGQIWIALAWLLMLTVIGIPLGVMMFNGLPKVIALRESSQTVVANVGHVTVIGSDLPQVNIILRILYFLLIGWWLSGLWVELAYFICLTVLGLPIGLWMVDKTPFLLSLRKQ